MTWDVASVGLADVACDTSLQWSTCYLSAVAADAAVLMLLPRCCRCHCSIAGAIGAAACGSQQAHPVCGRRHSHGVTAPHRPSHQAPAGKLLPGFISAVQCWHHSGQNHSSIGIIWAQKHSGAVLAAFGPKLWAVFETQQCSVGSIRAQNHSGSGSTWAQQHSGNGNIWAQKHGAAVLTSSGPNTSISCLW